MGGFNNNPSARQFLAAYKRVLTHSEIQEVSRGNCVPLESVTILTASSHYLKAPNVSVPSSSVINHSLHKSRVLEADVTAENREYELDSDSLASASVLSPYSDKIVGYIAGFVSLKLKRSLNCESCCNALFSQHLDATHVLISVKNKGHLSFPSRDVVAICLVCERKFREKVLLCSDQPYTKLSTQALHTIVTLVLSEFQEKMVFSSLAQHMLDSEPVTNHLVLLIKAVAETYLQVRYRYAGRQFTARLISLKGIKSRTSMNKLVLFSGM